MLDNRWTKEQAEAITAGDCNLLVAAAAGAGKTAVLVERIIQKITAAENPIDIDRLLVMTFTKAAATEMRERIAQAIADELERDPQNRNIRRQLTLLNKAGITTVHSFCLEVIRSNFQIIDLDPGFRISDETEASLLKLEVLNELFEEIYEQEKDNQAFYELLECYGNNRDDQVLQGMVLNLYDFVQSSPRPEAWLKKMTGNFQVEESMDFGQTPWGKVLLASIGIEFEGLRKKMNKAVSMLDKADGLEKYLPVFEEDLNFIKHVNGLYLNGCIPGWDQLYGIIKGFEFGKLPPAGQEADKDVQEKVKEIRDDVKKCLNRIKDGIFSAASEEIAADLLSLYPSMKCLVGLALEFKERYGIKKKEKSIVDFNDLEHFCLQILTEQSSDLEAVSSEFTPSKVALVYKQRFAEILVDEYQDSNLVQEIIIRMISREDLQEPNVFMVGDVKQSIYKFRQARPELFLEKYNSYSFQTEASKRKIILAKNFRSREEVIEAVNFIFKQIMSARVGELDYTDQEVLYPGAAYPEIDETELFAGGEVEFHLIQTKENIGNAGNTADNTENDQDINENYIDNEGEHSPQGEMLDNLQLEARLAARRIQELMKPDDRGRRFAVFDKDRKSYRSIEYKDIVILLRTTKNWADIFAEELALQGIPAFADTGTGFFKTSEVQVILALLQIIDNPLQDIPLLAVLRSPLFSFSTEELAELRLLKSHGLFYESLQAATNPKAILFMAKLKKWRDESFYLSTDQLLWQIYSETGYYGIAGALPGGEQRQANLRVLFERARQYEETSFKGLFNFINFIDKLKSSKGDMGSAKILGENDNVVRLMSIHKSKGLEFPVVILAGNGKKINFQDMNKSVLFHQELGLGPDVVDYKLRLAYPSLAKLAIREKIKIETLSEEMRILYVALTRAKEKLIITGAVKDVAKAIEKWNKLSENGEEDRLSVYDIFRGERYLDWLGPALARHQNWSGLCRIWDRKLVTDASPVKVIQDELHAECNLKTEFKEEIERRLNWEYPYAKVSGIPAKVSVTELKRRFEKEVHYSSKRPLFLEGKKGFSAAETGTIMHFVMQHLEFVGDDQNQDNLRQQVEKMVDKELLTAEQAETVDLNKIHRFLVSGLGRRMTASGNVQREVPFNIEISCQEVFKELAEECYQDETVLLQGVIDCYFEEPDGIVLIDYKTDYVRAGELDNIREKYRRQIFYYAHALEKLTGKMVKEKYIYLFSVGEVLEY